MSHLKLEHRIGKMKVNHMTEMVLALSCSCRLVRKKVEVQLTRKKVELEDCKKIEVPLTRKKTEVQLTRKRVEMEDCKKTERERELELELHIYFLLPELEEIHTRHCPLLAHKKVPRVCSDRRVLVGHLEVYTIEVSSSLACT